MTDRKIHADQASVIGLAIHLALHGDCTLITRVSAELAAMRAARTPAPDPNDARLVALVEAEREVEAKEADATLDAIEARMHRGSVIVGHEEWQRIRSRHSSLEAEVARLLKRVSDLSTALAAAQSDAAAARTRIHELTDDTARLLVRKAELLEGLDRLRDRWDGDRWVTEQEAMAQEVRALLREERHG